VFWFPFRDAVSRKTNGNGSLSSLRRKEGREARVPVLFRGAVTPPYRPGVAGPLPFDSDCHSDGPPGKAPPPPPPVFSVSVWHQLTSLFLHLSRALTLTSLPAPPPVFSGPPRHRQDCHHMRSAQAGRARAGQYRRGAELPLQRRRGGRRARLPIQYRRGGRRVQYRRGAKLPLRYRRGDRRLQYRWGAQPAAGGDVAGVRRFKRCGGSIIRWATANWGESGSNRTTGTRERASQTSECPSPASPRSAVCLPFPLFWINY
jgi:hypothetical protein